MSLAEPTVALVFSPEIWVEELHRHLAHHGGARVRQIVVEPAVALDEEYDVLVVSDRWPSLTLLFVGAVHERGRRILGVFDSEEPAGKDHLLALGVDASVAADATMDEFVAAIAGLAARSGSPIGAHAAGIDPSARTAGLDRGPLVVVSGPRGGGVTEIALGLACALADRPQPAVLIDAHAAAPAVAGRLGLGLEPNLRTAVDAHAHGIGTLDAAVAVLDPPAPASLRVVAGFPSPVAAAQVTPRDVADAVDALRRDHRAVIADADDASLTTRALVDRAVAVVGVVAASPVGVVRALDWIEEVRRDARTIPLHVVVNHVPTSRFRQEEIRREILRAVTPASLSWIPADRRVGTASWNGESVPGGPFRKAVRVLADAVVPVPPRRHRRWR